jgi:protein-tyrosine phosphatase
MKTDIYWIPELGSKRLAIMPRPRAGDWLEDEIKAWHQAGIKTVVSLLTSFEQMELKLQDEPAICQKNAIEYISYPISDRQVPNSRATIIELVRTIQQRIDQGNGVAIHCRMGIGRSALVAACVLVSQGFNVRNAFSLIEKVRGMQVPDTNEQVEWVSNLSAHLVNTFKP